MPDYSRFDDAASADLQRVGDLVRQQMALQNEVRNLVVKLRGRFVPWEDIAVELVVTRQAAQQRYGRLCES